MQERELKRFTVTAGDRTNPVVHTGVIINGVTAGMPLSPTIARQAAIVAVGHCRMVSVECDDDGHWYRLYGSGPGQQRRYKAGPRRPVGRPKKPVAPQTGDAAATSGKENAE